ncbi:MAG: PorP/SprF family type IX secretion system membrane protein [Saprospiraceae bacterium]
MSTKLTLAFVCISTFLLAQDPHFSQFYNAQTFTNPAFMGAYEGSMRGTLIYRSQWASVLDDNAFRTVGGSFDSRFPVSKHDLMALGMNIVNDQSGVSNFNIFRAHLGGSYQKKLGGDIRRYSSKRNDQYVNVGFQVGAGQHRYDQNLWFSNQFNTTTGQVDLNASNGEPAFNRSTNLYMDLNAGVLWYALLGDNKSVHIGASLLHANAPSLNYRVDKNYTEILKWRWVTQIGCELPFSSTTSILPALIYQKQGASQMTLGGANIRYNNQDWREVALRMGAWLRVANRLKKGQTIDALILSTVLETEKLNFGLSYDINVSTLVPASNYRGAFELSITYMQPRQRRGRQVTCPRF